MARTILIVDDLELNRAVLQNALCDEYTIITASSGMEAQSIIARKGDELSAVLLDIVMPEMDGYAVLGWMRSMPELAQIPVIMITGAEDEHSRVKALSMGANDYVIKPYNPDIIKHCLKNSISLKEAAVVANTAKKDKLTGLYNREAFFEKAGKMIAAQEPGYYILASFDIDNFKYVNDQYGAAEGDRILQHIAVEMHRTFNEVEGLCGRIYGDNFAVLYPNEPGICEYVAEKRETTFIPADAILSLQFSVGRYVVTDAALPVSTMFDRAHLAKQSVKGLYGQSVAYFDDSMLRTMLEEQLIIGRMDSALMEREFEAWFQPQYNHTSGALIGAEALARWRHPEKGIIPPGVFIPVFEKNGFVYELDKYVWEEVCIYLRKWMDEGRRPLPVSVNISRYDIFMPDLIDVLTGLVEKYSLPVELLRLEVTESAFSFSPEHIVSVVKILIGHGFTVEIDDFGSGYSSLNTLKSVPAQVVKLDMRFLDDDDGSERGGNILESIVRMTKWLGMSVIAEGVEDRAQADFLRSIGCSYVQGYLYARPMPASEYEACMAAADKEERLLNIEAVENHDNNAFWDPHSMDTLIFNSYVGGACIFEYHNGKIELLRATAKYVDVIGSAGMTVEDALRLNWAEHFDAETACRIAEDLEKSFTTKSEVTGEYAFLDLPNCPHTTYLRSTMRVIATAGGRHLVYCTNENITAQREAELRERLAAEQLRAIVENVDLGILAAIVENGTARFIFASDRYYEMLGYTKAQFEAELGSPYSIIAPEDRERIREETLRINHVGGKAVLEYAALTRNGGKLLVRMMISIANLTGIEQPVQFAILRDITEEAELRQRERMVTAQIQNMMNDIPGGFARIRHMPDGGLYPVYLNEGLEKLTGMDHDELMELYKTDAMAGVHKDDVPIVRDFVERMLAHGEASCSRYRLLRHGGGYVWLSIFGRVTKDVAGDTYLNIYYSDASEQVKQEETQRLLLDNLPSGAGIYELKDGRMSLVYQNKSFWELVGLGEETYPDASSMSAIHPDDNPIVMRELSAAIEQGRDVACDVRLRHLTKGYIDIHLAGRIICEEDGGFLIYATFTPNYGQEKTYQKVLPLLLSTIMEASNDYAFAKDKDFRYICCSPAFLRLAGLSDELAAAGKTDYEIFPADMAEQFRKNDLALIESGKPMVDYEETIGLPDGTVQYCIASKYLLHGVTGEVIGIYGVSRDITKERSAFEQLRLVNDSIPGGIATYAFKDGRLHVAYCNDGFCRLFGGTREGFTARGAFDPVEWVIEADRPELLRQVAALAADGAPIDCIFRIRVIGGGFKWINLKAASSEHRNGTVVFNAVLFDFTDRQTAMERLSISEEENRLAIAHSRTVVCRYDIAAKTLAISPNANEIFALPTLAEDVPRSSVEKGAVSADTAEDFIAFFERITRGEKSGEAVFQLLSREGWRWIEGRFSSVFADSGEPSSAVISFRDVTEVFERDAAYRKWLQSIRSKDPAAYSLLRCNLSKETVIESLEGALLGSLVPTERFDFEKRIKSHVKEHVVPEDREAVLAFLNLDAMRAKYHQGEQSSSVELRESLPGGEYRWVRLTVDLVEHPHASDIEAYMLFEDIDKEKREQLAARERAEHDSMTGVLNRAAFEEKVNRAIQTTKPNVRHAMLMLDIDGFKQVNDSFGHAAGDRALMDIAAALRSVMRHEDLVGRLGGDEFAVFIENIPSDTVAANKAKQICSLVRKSFSAEVEISGSVGIAITPRDGTDFDMLYKSADSALYYVKGSGKDNYAFYMEDMAEQHLELRAETAGEPGRAKKRRMLIVDDSMIDNEMLTGIFADDFIVEKARDGNTALIRLRHYGSAISVVLLDLMMPGMDGFTVLKKMQESAELARIPVIVVSSDKSRDSGLRAIRAGADDYVTKPVDRDVLLIRVQSAVSKAENERLRAKNAFLELENSEINRYKTILELSGIVAMELDWVKGDFTYGSTVPSHIAGNYDGRRLWTILLSDFVAGTQTVKRMQDVVHQLAADPNESDRSITVELKTPRDEYHSFRMNVYKTVNEYGLADKLYLTFTDLDGDKPDG